MRVTATARMDGKATVEIVSGLADRAAYRGAQRMATRVRENIRSSGRVNTGRMLNSVKATRDRRDRLNPAYIVGPRTGYAKFQDRGTRGHGPRRAKVLRFVPKGGSKAVYARWVRGVTPANFMAKAVASMKASDFAK